jgi:hypothetical protein
MTTRVASLATIACVLSVSVAAAQSKKSIDVGDPPPIHAFSVTLVVGEMQGGLTPDNLPPGARKALTDTRDFLPYKSFRLLDTQFIRCCASSQPDQVLGRLRGVDEQPYSFRIHFNYLAPRLSIHFSLQESGPKPSFSSKSADSRDDQIAEERKTLETRDALEQTRREIEEGRKQLLARERQLQESHSNLASLRELPKTHPQVAHLQKSIEQLQKELSDARKTVTMQESAARELELKLRMMFQEMERNAGVTPAPKASVIDSTFSMDIGETVVIGTSSLKGDKALIALLTAVRRPGTAQGEKK